MPKAEAIASKVAIVKKLSDLSLPSAPSSNTLEIELSANFAASDLIF